MSPPKFGEIVPPKEAQRLYLRGTAPVSRIENGIGYVIYECC